MSEGIVVGWDDHRGYGFVRPSEGGGADIFVHRRDILNAIMLKQGLKVSFDTEMDERRGKPQAVNVRVIHDAARNQPGTAGGFDAIAHDNNFVLSPLHD
jgi:cold shock CspA family protein